ncbi:MAG TPA: TIGR03936 family radical SAM-associated protein [Gemmataceae bacterium]|jgi:radical SAM-linked protein|nr:TIGR03936 family radical SAM-associated protein [Gemmataceae bacterium]
MVCDKVRIRFRKSGDLRLISHHDLMRCFERMLRRAALPFHSTSGFNPKPRLIFAMPLPLGTSGSGEIVELELDQDVPPHEVRERLAREAPQGLEIVSVERIAPKTTAHVRKASYRIALDVGDHAALPERITALLANQECWIERERPQHKRINARPYLDGLRLTPDALEVDLLVTPNGSIRPDEVLQLLELTEVLESGVLIERTGLDIEEPTPAELPAVEHSSPF